jgi:uncharacterized protein
MQRARAMHESTAPFSRTRRLAQALATHPRAVLACLLALTVGFGVAATGTRIENSLESVLPDGDEAVAYYNEVRGLFGSDDVAVIGVRAAELFSPATLTKIARVTEQVAKLPGVEKVISVTNAVDVAADLINPPKLLARVPPTAEDVAHLQAVLAERPIYRRNLIAEHGQGTAINVFFKPINDAEYEALGIDRQIMQIIKAAEGPERFSYTGAAHVKQAAVGLMRDDLVVFTPLAVLLVVLVLWVSFRTRRGVMVPLMAVGAAVVWTLGIMVMTGHAISIGTFVLPPLLLVVGSSYAIHVMARYYEQVIVGDEPAAVVVRAFERVCVPLGISAATTLIGFGSLMTNRIPAVWELGCFAVVGVVCLTITTLLGMPAALAILPLDRVAARSEHPTSLTNLLGRLAKLAYASRRLVMAVALLVAVIAVWGITLIQVDSDFLYYFRANEPVRVDNELINREIVGSNPFYVVVEGPPGFLRRWEVLKQIRDLQTFIESLSGVTATLSLVDYLELLEKGLAHSPNDEQGGDLVVGDDGQVLPASEVRSFWDDPRSLGPVLAAVATVPDTFKGVVTKDFSKANITVRTNLSGSRAIEHTLNEIRAYVAGHFPADVPVRLTGNLVLLSGTTSDIVTGQIESLSIALAVIFVVIALMYLSVRIAALAIIANLLPILVFFGVMGWFGILLNLGTSLIAAIALGIAVDSTIHYMSRLQLEVQGESDQEAAIVRALKTVGVPIVFTTVALLLGFLTFGFSSFVPIQNFGILSAVTMAGALVANLILLPALLAQTTIITLWDLLRVDLGEDPARTIPLFAGLRKAQARVVILMGRLERYRDGQPVVRRGEKGDEMYVVIRGRAKVMVGDGDQRQTVNQLKRGDVFGEMGLVRQKERTADVVANGDLQVLAVDQRFLDRIQRRYPRIASKVFLNLTRILSDHVERMTNLITTAAR